MIDVLKLEAGREMDARVSEIVLGLDICRCQYCIDNGPDGACETCGKSRSKFYSTHVERALGVLEQVARKLRLSYLIERTEDPDGAPSFGVTFSGATRALGRGTGSTLALAACRAALSVTGKS